MWISAPIIEGLGQKIGRRLVGFDERGIRQMCESKSIFVDNLDPTFLFSWKGTRRGPRSGGGDNYHVHEYLEVAMVLSGHGRYLIEDKLYDVTEGDLLVFNPGTRHRPVIIEGNEMPSVEFFVGGSDFRIKDMPKNCLPLPEEGCILHTAGELRQRLFRICASMEAENSAYRQGRYYMMKSYLIQIILLIVREQYEPEEKKAAYPFESANKKYVVEQIIGYFEEHYNEKISLDQIAENMYMSPFYLSKIFKSETGDTPIRHLIDIRLEKARELLEQGWGGSIQAVAASVGYDDAYHFSKLFKKKYGVSPSRVKKAAE